MKKLIVMLFILMSFSASVSAQGKIVGSYVNTDIVAYINGYPIKSYNIDGWTGVVAEDLRDYGFDVNWNEEERTLHIGNHYFPTPIFSEENLQGSGKITADYIPEPPAKSIGSFAGNIYSTNIKTYVSGEEVKAFNIGGRTIIYIDDLSRFGNVIWHEDERQICYNYVKPWNISLHKTNYTSPTENNISSFTLDITKNTDGIFITEGENLDYLDYLKLFYNKHNGMCFGFSIYQRVLFQTEELYNLLYDISTERYDGTVLSENADLANKHMKISINGAPIKITKVSQGKGSGHIDFYFWIDCSLSQEDINSVSIEFK